MRMMAAAFAVAAATASGAGAGTMTFDTVSNGPTYTEAGATIAALPGSANVNTTGTALGFGCCAPPIFANWSLTTGGLFNLVSIFVQHVDAPDPVTFTALLNGVAQAGVTFTNDAGAYNFSGFTNIDEVRISFDARTYADPTFDNLVFETAAIPLPATALLLVAGLGGLGVLRRFRNV